MKHQVEKAIEAAKYFANPKPKTPEERCCWIDESYVWSFNGAALIKIEHNNELISPYYYPYYKKDFALLSDLTDPSPPVYLKAKYNKHYAKYSFTVSDLAMWKSAHELGAIVESTHKKVVLNPTDKVLSAQAHRKDLPGNFASYRQEHMPIESKIKIPFNISYNASFMANAVKAFQKLKLVDMSILVQEKRKPLFIEGAGVSITLMPIVHDFGKFKTSKDAKIS